MVYVNLGGAERKKKEQKEIPLVHLPIIMTHHGQVLICLAFAFSSSYFIG